MLYTLREKGKVAILSVLWKLHFSKTSHLFHSTSIDIWESKSIFWVLYFYIIIIFFILYLYMIYVS